jgi:hypothetical protein
MSTSGAILFFGHKRHSNLFRLILFKLHPGAQDSIKKTSSWSAGQEISHVLRKPQIRHLVPKSKSLVPKASQAKTGHTAHVLPPILFHIRLLSILRSSKWPLFFSFSDSNPVLIFSSPDACYVAGLPHSSTH